MKTSTVVRMAVCVVLGIALCGVGVSYAATPAGAKPIYDESGNGQKILADALAKAKKEHKNVLIQLGGNWCVWCVRLHATFTSDPTLAKLLQTDYVYTPIDTNSNPALTKRLAPNLNGVPYLVVMAPDGAVITRHNTDSFVLNGKSHDPKKLAAFLNKFKPKRMSAQAVLDHALAQAKKQNKKVFLSFGAEWCPWCKKLKAFMARPDMAPIFGANYISLEIDMDRNAGANALLAHYTKNAGGIPWYAILNSNGKCLITSEGPHGNFGYPGAEESIAHFMKMLRTTAPKLTKSQLDSVERALQKAEV